MRLIIVDTRNPGRTPWARAQINLAPYEAETNEVLVVASGKAKNAEEFESFGIRLDSETMTYERDDSVDLEAWKKRIGAATREGKGEAKVNIGLVRKIVEAAGVDGISKPDLVRKVKAETSTTSNYPYDVIDKAEAKKAIVRTKSDEHYVVPRR